MHLMQIEGKMRMSLIRVLAELGIELDQKVIGINAPSAMPPSAQADAEEEVLSEALPDLKARLDV